MKIYLFVSETEPSVKAFTADQTGANLPASYAPWCISRSGSAVSVGGDGDRVSVMVRRDGYFLVSGKVESLTRRTTH
jgi:hypothetical protein